MSFLLAHRIVEGAHADRAAYVLHGALGSGQNFGRFAARLAEARPDRQYVLVDLRNHGRSAGAPPPHTLESCARDVLRLAEHLGKPVDALIGHSFGGKVALELLRLAEAGGTEPPRQVWVLDAVPGSQGLGEDGEVSAVIRAVRGVPMPAESRQDVVSHLVTVAGLSGGMAQWMATNLRREAGRYVWAFDLDGIEELMRDYFRVDLWPLLVAPRSRARIELVVAERSDRWTPALRLRASTLPAEAQASYHLLPDSGHWVHVDNPDGLLELMREQLI